MIKTNLLLILLASINPLFAQNHKFKSKIMAVETDGYFKIELSPEVLARAGYGLKDLRIWTDAGKEIPYIVNNEVPSFYEKNFIPYPIIENTSKGNTQTLIIDNSKHQIMNNLVMEMKNTSGEKKIRISGSDDKKNWFMLHQGFTFTVSGDENSTKIYKAIDFPMADYTWFSIAIIDTMPLSLNILRVGNYSQKMVLGKYCTIPRTLFFQKDSSDKKSYINILLEEPNLVDKLNIIILKPEQYMRSTELFINYSDKEIVSENSILSYRGYKENFANQNLSLNSDLENSFPISNNNKIKNIRLVIDNNDNQPLGIASIQLQQLKTYLIAKMEQGKTYYLQFGDSTIESPEYDLKYFEDKIPPNISIINHFGIQSNHPDNPANKSKNNKLFIWIALVLAGLLLSFMTNKMLREVKKTTD